MVKTKSTAAKSMAKGFLCSRSSGASASSGSGTLRARSDSPTGVPKVIVGNYDLGVLPKQWDDDLVIRDRMRSGMSLVVRLDHNNQPENGYVESTTENVKLNEAVLHPICILMQKNDLKPPQLEKIIEQIHIFYGMAKIWGRYETYYQQAWALRRLLGKLKTFTYREFPPED